REPSATLFVRYAERRRYRCYLAGMTAPHQVLRRADHVLLDFDGPVCAAFTTITDGRIAEALRQYLADHGHAPPAALRDTTEPLDVLAYTAGVSAELATAVEAELTRWECHAVRYADPTPHVRDVLVWLADSARSVSVVSNNATSSIERYLRSVELEAMVSG